MTRRHVVADFWVDDPAVLRYQEPVRSAIREGIRVSGARTLGERFHQFVPVGFSGCFLLAESHVAVHSFVEDHLLSLDIYTCGDADVEQILDVCRRTIRPIKERVHSVPRG